MKDYELSMLLRGWWKRVGGVSAAARRKSPVWVAMREIVGHYGNWRNARRGNPRKGYAVMKTKAEN